MGVCSLNMALRSALTGPCSLPLAPTTAKGVFGHCALPSRTAPLVVHIFHSSSHNLSSRSQVRISGFVRTQARLTHVYLRHVLRRTFAHPQTLCKLLC